MGEIKRTDQLLVGFALETNNEKEYALKKLDVKNADMIVLNSLNDAGAGFGHDTNKITIFDKQRNEYDFETKSKTEVAADIVNTIIQNLTCIELKLLLGFIVDDAILQMHRNLNARVTVISSRVGNNVNKNLFRLCKLH